MKAGMFLTFSNLAAGMSLVGPLICLWYYLSFGHTLDLTWYNIQYYWDSNVFFTFIITIILVILADKPFLSLATMRQDQEQAFNDWKNSIQEFRKSVTTTSKSNTADSQRYQEVPTSQSADILLLNKTDSNGNQ
jgi:hypothetical protein